MDTGLYLIIGFSMVTGVFLWSRNAHGMFLSPAVFYFSAFFMHAFLYPVVRFSERQVASSTWEYMSNYNIMCFAAAALGYAVITVLMPVRKNASRPIQPILSRQAYRWLAVIAIGLSLVALLLILYSGVASIGRGAFSAYGKQPLPFTIGRFIMNYTLIITCFLMLHAIFFRSQYSLLLGFAPFAIIALIDIISLGRQSTLLMVVTVFIAFVARSDRFGTKHFIRIAGIVAVILFISMFRKIGIGFTEISLSNFLAAKNAGILSMQGFLTYVAETIPGQQIFYTVASRWTGEDPFYGITYVFSFLSAIGLGFMVPEGFETPSRWFARNFFTLDTNYGRDFSLVTETFINFGSLGFLVFVLIGLFVGFLNARILKLKNIFWLLWCVFMVTNLIIAFRNDSLPFFTRSTMFIVPLILFLAVYREMLRQFPKV